MMLAKTPAAAVATSGVPISLQLPLRLKIGLRTTVHVWNWWNGGRSSGAKRRSNGGALVVRASYTRRPMETAGAYRLVDDQTGEKVIVWGGLDQEDKSIPSDEVLSWKPSDNKYVNRSALPNADNRGQGIRDGARNRVSAGSFGRLKALRVRELAQRTPKLKQRVGGTIYDEKVKDVVSSQESELLEKQPDDLRNSHVSRISRSSEARTPVQEVLTREVMDKYENLPEPQTTSIKCQKFYKADSVSGSSAASLRGWGVVHSSPNVRSKPEDVSKKWRKSNAGHDFFSRKSFRELGCSDHLIDALKNLDYVRPSHVQAMAFTSAVTGKSCIVADQSGSGKTLAYLLPVIQRLRQEELEGRSKPLPNNPRVVILVPTAELAAQVLRNCRSMSKFGIPFRSMVATGGFRQRTQLENLKQDLDVLIATPGRFTSLINEGFLQLTNIRCVVLDEVDILFKDEDFEPALQSLINSSPVTAQYLFVTATLPVKIYNKLVETFPDCELIMGPGMHRTSSGLEEILVDCSGEDGAEKSPDSAFLNKKSALLRLIEGFVVSKTIVFCNKIETCRKVENALKRIDRRGAHIKVLPFHAALAQELRLANMEEFCRPQSEDSSLFLICTDRASRGIDFAGVDHVVLFDFPRDPSEYVRRVGRTARGAGGRGKAFVFVVGRQVSLARRIIERNMKGHPLHDLPSV